MPNSPAIIPEDRFAAFRHKAYSLYFIARFSTSFAAQIVSTAVGWQIWEETHNAFWLGMIGLVQFLPALLLVLITGLASDKFGRRRVMGGSIILETCCAVAILYLAFTQQFHPLWVLAILTVFGVARAFYTPASTSLVVNLVPKEDFANAVGWITSSWQLASIMGPVAGGLLFGISGSVAYSCAAIIMSFAAIMIFSLEKPKQILETAPVNIKTLLGGFRYIWQEKIVLGAISLDLFAVLLGGAVALLPIYASDVLNLGSVGLGLLRAAPGIGAVITIGVLIAFPIKKYAGPILFISVALFGFATTVFGFSTWAWLSILALMFVGAFDMVSVYIREILLQLWTPDAVRGRVNAVNSIFLGASNELGEFRAGSMAAAFGAVFAVTAGGIAAIGIAGLWIILFPKLRQAQYLHKAEIDGSQP
ncbi:putative MFS family arabinose efflux permease [Litorimonas taeanensis]|uniref:Multidrug efflux pump Tap n=1 Tax=Litorimonas taeanensis TaxID=568099 RepID=A0A420WET3_9PROT|nr:MFS transporter [Litorimonas taeanensis]RKQ69486.1 putative MFS family arabinose efflux permease [Litorimonas taeanensis]